MNEDEDDEDSPPDEINEPKKKPGKSLSKSVNPSFYLSKKDDTDDSVIFAENSIGHESFNESKVQVSVKKSITKTDDSEEEECEYDEDEDEEDFEDPQSSDQIDRQFIYIQVC